MYLDGVDIVKQTLSIFAGRRSVVVIMLVKLYKAPAERLQPHNLHIATVAFGSDCKSFGYDEVVGGNPLNPECTSVGGSMRRCGCKSKACSTIVTGLSTACRYAEGQVHMTPDGPKVFTGHLHGVKGDNPQISAVLSLNESYQENVFAICKQCMVSGKEMAKLDVSKTYMMTPHPCTERSVLATCSIVIAIAMLQ